MAIYWDRPCYKCRSHTCDMSCPEPVQEPITLDAAWMMGAKGAQPTEAERLLFEAWMRGHCWAVIGDWNGTTYVHEHESNGYVVPSAANTRQLWAAWRDRAALAAAPQAKPLTDEQIGNLAYKTEGEHPHDAALRFARAIEAAHGITTHLPADVEGGKS